MSLPPRVVAAVLALWCAGPLNQTLWRSLGLLTDFNDPWGLLRLGCGVLIASATYLWLMLWSWPYVRLVVWSLSLLVGALAQYYMLHYGVVMDDSMVRNVLATNPSEGLALLTPTLAWQLLLYAGLPMLWLWCGVRMPVAPWRSNWWRSALAVLAALAVLVGSVMVQYRELAPLMRSHKALRYMVNPLASVVSTLTVALDPVINKKRAFVSLTAGASLGPTYAAMGAAAAKPPLLIMVVGETARADRFSLNGYARPTNPELQQRGVISWRQVHSCGTNTLASVPCMFSSLGKQGYESRDADYSNLLDVLQASGLAVQWLENQSGCKDVCNRVPSAEVSSIATAEARSTWCAADGECLDQLVLGTLDGRMAALSEAERNKGVVLVVHQMGSHGPAYYKRSSTATKRFMPECTTHVTSNCAQNALDNVYDNSIAETDLFLSQLIDWLKTQQAHYATSMLYVSDHGESLGEKGLYLHGMPYAIAPDVQKHVPWVLWPGTLQARTGMDEGCARASTDKPYTHDNYYHTVLGMLDVHSPTYKPALDMLAPCRPKR
jgi:lipid A ethanolaminephosphotransferase